jgi:hypothetical protein
MGNNGIARGDGDVIFLGAKRRDIRNVKGKICVCWIYGVSCLLDIYGGAQLAIVRWHILQSYESFNPENLRFQ